MQYELEIEMKNLLTKEEFNCLKQYFSFQDTDFVTQTNYYFETKDDDFRKNKWNLRIRKRKNEITLTLKQKRNGDVNEYHLPLTEEEMKEILAGKAPSPKVTEILTVVHAQHLRPEWIGSLQTKRAQCTYKDGEIFLDESTYFQQTDYEVEYEVRERLAGEKIFAELLRTHHIQQKEAPSKIARFHAYKNKIKAGDKW